MSGNFDDIIRRVLGMERREPDPMQQPFQGSELGPAIQDFLNESEREVPIAEDQLPHLNDLDLQRLEMLGGSQRMPYQPGRSMLDSSVPMIIPNYRPDREYSPDAPLSHGNAKYGSGIDV